MAIIKTPDRTYQLGETPPPLPQKVVSWPWGGSPSLTRWALDALKYPLGTIIMDTIDGHPVIVQIQTHGTYGAHPEWGTRPHKGTSVFVPVDDAGHPVKDPPDGWAVSPMAGWTHDHNPFTRALQMLDRHDRRWGANRGVTSPEDRLNDREHMNWRDHYAKVPKLAILAGTTVLGFAAGGPFGAVAGLAAGLGIDREVRGGSLFPSFSGEGSWKVKRYDPTTGAFYYVGVVNAGSEGAAVDAATSQLFAASAAKPYSLPGFTNVYITSAGDVFRLGMES